MSSSPAPRRQLTQQWRITPVVLVVPPVVVVPLPPVLPPPSPPVPVVDSSGAFQLIPSARVNLDNGVLGFAGADLFYQAVNFTDVQLTPVNGAQISYTGGAQRGYWGCSAAAFSNAPVPQAAIAIGDYVCVLTDQGRIAEFQINNVGLIFRALWISYTTWQ